MKYVTRTLLIALCMHLSSCALLEAKADRQKKEAALIAYREQVNLELAKSDVRDYLHAEASKDPTVHDAQESLKKARAERRIILSPNILHNEEVTYPKQARRDIKEGYVFFSIIVGPTGMPEKITHIHLPTLLVDQVFIDAGKSSLEKWRFSPGSIDGIPVNFPLMIPIRFRLEP